MSTEAELRAFVTKVANLDGRTEVRMIDLLLLVNEAKALTSPEAAAAVASFEAKVQEFFDAGADIKKEDTPHES